MITEIKINILPRDVDFSKHLSPQTLGSIILDAAGIAARDRGFGMSFMNERNAAWVVSRFSVQVYSLPMEFETITVKTWVKSVNSIFSRRLFSISDENGNLLVEADSLWSVINLANRKSEDILSLADLTPFIDDEDVQMTSASKVPKVDPDNAQSFNHNIVYSDIDMNYHVNSMKYLQWIFDTFTFDHFKNNSPLRIDINYLKEMRFAENATIFCQNTEKTSIFNIQNAENSPCCRVKLTWK